MKKQLIAIGLLSFLIVPSVVFGDGDACAPTVSEGMTEAEIMAAQADMMGSSECMNQRLGAIEDGISLYGSFRTGLIFGDGDSNVSDIVSRWGIIGSHEVSEGLTASYRYEAKMNTTSAASGGGDPGGRLSQIGLSGGFGTVSLGQIWSASAVHYGFKVDPSYYNGVFGGASYRQGNSVSYSSSAGDVTFQIDKVTGDWRKSRIRCIRGFRSGRSWARLLE